MMTATEYEFLVDFLQQRSGLCLGPGKEYLLESRLIPLAQSLGLSDFQELIRELRKNSNRALSTAVTEAMTTNETSFFRDKTPFEDLRKVILPNLIRARANTRKLQFWCAAASSGQEPYSVLMLIEEHFPELRDWQIDFLATDLSNNILAKAEAGVYSQFEIQRGLPIQFLMKYFEQSPAGWQIKNNLRKRVRFQQLNLLENFQRVGQCDIIFCRNVLIYFDTERKSQIFDGLCRQLRPDGYMLLGAAETVLGISDKFSRYRECQSGVYTPVKSGVTTSS